jgi:hypothetical protein
MGRLGLFFSCLAAFGVGCQSRVPVSTDSAVSFDGSLHDSSSFFDAPAGEAGLSDAFADTLGACQQLSVLGTATLGTVPNNYNVNADLAHDGSGFGTVWISDQNSPSSTSGQLLFSKVDYAANVLSPKDVLIANGAMKFPKPLLLFQNGEYLVFYHTSTSAVFARLDGQGKVLATYDNIGAVDAVALAGNGSGFAVLYALKQPGASSLVFAQIGNAGFSGSQTISSGSYYGYLWLHQTATGYAAAWGDTFAILSSTGSTVGTPKTIGGEAVGAWAYAVAPTGFALAYARDDFTIEAVLLDASGEPQGQPQSIAQANIGAAPLQQVFLHRFGGYYALAYPAAEPGGIPHVQLLDDALKPVGPAVELPSCLAFSMTPVSMAAGNDRLAVAHIGGLSGPPGSAICAAVLQCQ